MNLSVAKIVGNLGESSWSQVHEFLPAETEKLNSHGELLAAVSFRAKQEIEISSFGTEIIQRLQEIYYSNQSGSILKKLSQTIETLTAEFLDQVELEVVALVVWQDYLYAGRNAAGQVWFKRGDNLVKLFGASAAGIETVSGELKASDVLVAATSQFNQLVPEGSLRGAIGQESAAAIAESLTTQVYGHKDNSQAAAVVAKVAEAVDETAVPESSPPRLSVLARLQPLINQLKQPLANLAARLSLGRNRAIFVGNKAARQRQTAITVVLVLLLVLGASLLLAGRKRQNTERQQSYQTLVDEVNYKLDEADSLMSLNPLRAKSLLHESEVSLEAYLGQKGVKETDELVGLKQRLVDTLNQVEREYRVDNADEWYDFDLVKDGFRGQAWGLSGSQLLVWDDSSRTAVLLNLETKAAKMVVSGGDLGSARAVGLTDDRGFIVAADKVTVIDTAKEKTLAAVEADGWQQIKIARGFGSNLYLLDAAITGQIWKYLGLDDGLSGKRSYLVGDSFDLSEAMDMTIDGSVWVLFSDGTIVKYTQGKKDAFQVVGLDQPLGEAVKLFTSPEVDHIYVIDRSSTRVVVLDKSGEYVAQYQWPGIAGVKDLVVSEALGKIFFLTGEKVFTLDLK
ncbi:hypothetical protein KKH13_03050 [Patescibacteria group bacterium]|nr:hypothetical protein [Patescibacteria group bacterium]